MFSALKVTFSDGHRYIDNCGRSRANTCTKTQLRRHGWPAPALYSKSAVCGHETVAGSGFLESGSSGWHCDHGEKRLLRETGHVFGLR